jgi:FlaA1/EpsC-like NDP-sugar epimerase
MKSFLELPRLHKQLIAASADLLLLPLTFYLAILLRYDGVSKELFLQYAWLIVSLPIISIPIFSRLGLYRAVIRFIDHKIVYVAVLGVTLSVLILAAIAAFTTHMAGLSRGVFGIYWLGAIMYMVASRFISRGYLLRASGPRGVIRVAIYGTGRAGTQLASALRAGHEYLPVAFIDDAKELERVTIAGIKVWSPKNLPVLIAKNRIKEVLLAMPSITKTQKKNILDHLEPLKVKIKVTPPFKNWVSGVLRAQDVRDIEIEDLLGRDTVAPDPGLIARCITDKTVMVTGAGGSIGSELCRQIM